MLNWIDSLLLLVYTMVIVFFTWLHVSRHYEERLADLRDQLYVAELASYSRELFAQTREYEAAKSALISHIARLERSRIIGEE